MKVSSITEDKVTDEIIDKLLFEGWEKNHTTVDCIVVLGSLKAPQYRVPAAVEAYKEGYSDKLMFCGGKIRDVMGKKISEAELMVEKALELGIPASDIIVENNSRNTIENILYSLVELQRHFELNNVKNVLLVTTTYHMRRSLALARYFYPKHITLYPCPVDDTNTRRENWMNTEVGRKRVTAEVMKIVTYVSNGVFPDFEI